MSTSHSHRQQPLRRPSAPSRATASGRARIDRAERPSAERPSGEFDQLVRSLSHDMTANFHVLARSFDSLKQRCGPTPLPELAEGMAHVEACLGQSKRLLEDLGLLARTGQVDMQPARVELGEVVREVLFELGPLAAQRRVQVVVDPALPAVWCNRARAKQMLDNLLQNALRYGCDADQPRIEILRAADPVQPGFVGVRVADNGRGIPPESRGEVFLPGKRLDSASPSGSGLGLAIVKWIVEHYGGTVRIEAAEPSGAAVVFTLPEMSPLDSRTTRPTPLAPG